MTHTNRIIYCQWRIFFSVEMHEKEEILLKEKNYFESAKYGVSIFFSFSDEIRKIIFFFRLLEDVIAYAYTKFYLNQNIM